MHCELTNHTKNTYHGLGQWNREEIEEEVLCNTSAHLEKVDPEQPGHFHCVTRVLKPRGESLSLFLFTDTDIS